MSQSNIDLVRALFELRDRVQGSQAALSAAYDAAEDADNDAVRLDEASVQLNNAVVAVDHAIDSVAAYDGIRRALA